MLLHGVMATGLFVVAPRAAGTRVTPTWSDILRAYNVGHLGKYVPGKMMVPVLRSGLLQGPDMSPGKVVISVVYETISTMAVGGWVALLLFFRSFCGWLDAKECCK